MPNIVEKMTLNYSPNFHSRKRTKSEIKYLIFHYTGMRSDKSAIKKLTDVNSMVSCHYYINKKGQIIQMVPDLYVAWHAGKSFWKNDKNLNKNSIGIEISNPGHDHGYKKFTEKQIETLINLSKKLIKNYSIKRKNILGHSDIAPDRKKDPGEKFPWKDLAKSKVSQWHNLDEKKLKRERLILLNLIEENNFMMNLTKIGYFKISQKNNNSKKRIIIKAFQRHFRQKLINGIPDKECLIISKDLLKS